MSAISSECHISKKGACDLCETWKSLLNITGLFVSGILSMSDCIRLKDSPVNAKRRPIHKLHRLSHKPHQSVFPRRGREANATRDRSLIKPKSWLEVDSRRSAWCFCAPPPPLTLARANRRRPPLIKRPSTASEHRTTPPGDRTGKKQKKTSIFCFSSFIY